MVPLIEQQVMEKPTVRRGKEANLPEGVLCEVKYPIWDWHQLNRNTRGYEKAVGERVLADSEVQRRLKERNLWGDCEHPEESQLKFDPFKTSHRLSEITIDDDKGWATFQVFDTIGGRLIDTLLKAGCGVGSSTRADGELEEKTDEKGTKYHRVIPEKYKFITVDFTADPSTIGSLPEDIQYNVAEDVQKCLDEGKLDKGNAVMLLESVSAPKAKKILEKVQKLNEVTEANATATVTTATVTPKPAASESAAKKDKRGRDPVEAQRELERIIGYVNEHGEVDPAKGLYLVESKAKDGTPKLYESPINKGPRQILILMAKDEDLDVPEKATVTPDGFRIRVSEQQPTVGQIIQHVAEKAAYYKTSSGPILMVEWQGKKYSATAAEQEQGLVRKICAAEKLEIPAELQEKLKHFGTSQGWKECCNGRQLDKDAFEKLDKLPEGSTTENPPKATIESLIQHVQEKAGFYPPEEIFIVEWQGHHYVDSPQGGGAFGLVQQIATKEGIKDVPISEASKLASSKIRVLEEEEFNQMDSLPPAEADAPFATDDDTTTTVAEDPNGAPQGGAKGAAADAANALGDAETKISILQAKLDKATELLGENKDKTVEELYKKYAKDIAEHTARQQALKKELAESKKREAALTQKLAEQKKTYEARIQELTNKLTEATKLTEKVKIDGAAAAKTVEEAAAKKLLENYLAVKLEHSGLDGRLTPGQLDQLHECKTQEELDGLLDNLSEVVAESLIIGGGIDRVVDHVNKEGPIELNRGKAENDVVQQTIGKVFEAMSPNKAPAEKK